MIEISKAVIQEDGKYLLLKRGDHSKTFPGSWDFAGGKHESGETPTESVIRETEEETSFLIDPGMEVKQAQYCDNEHNLLFHYFTPRILSGNLSISSDHSAFLWVPKNEIGKLVLHPSVKLYFYA